VLLGTATSLTTVTIDNQTVTNRYERSTRVCSGMECGNIKSKRIPSIFNDESTGSFICLRRHIYMSNVNKVQLYGKVRTVKTQLRGVALIGFVDVY
jgi:hypothetical protein